MSGILKQWRLWILTVLLVGPVLVYVGFGSIWLWQRGWLWVAALLWIAAGAAFSILAARWTRNVHPIMPPLDWDSPGTFSPRDREAWRIVEEEARGGEALSMDALTRPDLYTETGRRLLSRLASSYHPTASDPLDQVPLLELLTAIELASEDLAQLCRQVPGGDLIALSHWRRAVKMAGYISKANDLYSMFSPLLNPLSGLVRLGTRELVAKPAWRDMQQNLLRWFYQAYVNRIGVHLIELMSGRLAIGAERYRRLTRRSILSARGEVLDAEPLVAIVVGARGSGKSRLIEALKQSIAGDPGLIRAGFEGRGLDPDLVERLREIRWVEVPGYGAGVDGESRREGALRQSTVAAAIDGDLLLLVIDGVRGLQPGDVAFVQAWDRYFMEHPQREAPPSLVVITGADRPDLGVVWSPPYDWTAGKGLRETSIRALFDTLRSTLPPTFNTFAAAGLASETPFGVAENVLPGLASQLHRAQRSALIRQLQTLSARSKASRIVTQLGQQGRQVLRNLGSRRKSASKGS